MDIASWISGLMRENYEAVSFIPEYEKRMRGYGEIAFRVLLDRCRRGGASSIHLRCAEDLPSVLFWQSCGFRISGVVDQNNQRKRLIVEMNYPLELPLFA